MTEDKNETIKKLIANTKHMVELHQKAQELLRRMILSAVYKIEGPMTTYEWDKRSKEVLYEAGLGPKPSR